MIPCQGARAETRVRQLLFISAGVISMNSGYAAAALQRLVTNQAFLLLFFLN